MKSEGKPSHSTLHHDNCLLCRLQPASSAPFTPAFGRDNPVAPATILGLYREYQADQGNLRQAFELPACDAWLDREQTLDEAWLGRLDKLDFDALDARERAEFLLLRSEIRGDLDDLALSRKRLAEIAPLVPFRKAIHELELSRRSWNKPDWQAAASKVADVAAAVKQAARPTRPRRAARRLRRRSPCRRPAPCRSCKAC